MDPVRIHIEIPKDLYDQVLARSVTNERSIRDEVVAVLYGQLPAFAQPAATQSDAVPEASTTPA